MSRLEELNFALTSVLVRYHEIKAPPKIPYKTPLEARVEEILAKPPTEMLASLTSLIDACIELKWERGPLLHYLLYTILSVRFFLNPVAVAVESDAAEPQPSPSGATKEPSSEEQQQKEIEQLYRRLISGEKVPTASEIEQHLIDLVVNVQTLLLPTTKSHMVNYGGISVSLYGFANGWTAFSTSLCDSGRLLEEELFLPLGLKPHATDKIVEKQIRTIFAEKSEVLTLRQEVSTLTHANSNLAEELAGVMEHNNCLTTKLSKFNLREASPMQALTHTPPTPDKKTHTPKPEKARKKSVFASGLTNFSEAAAAVSHFLFEDEGNESQFPYK